MSTKTFSEVSANVKDANPEMGMQRGFPIKPMPFSETEYYDTSGNKLSKLAAAGVRSDGKGGYVDRQGNKVYKWDTEGDNAGPTSGYFSSGGYGQQFDGLGQQVLGLNEGFHKFMNDFLDDLRNMGHDFKDILPPYFNNPEIECNNIGDVYDTMIENIMTSKNFTYKQHCDLIMKLGAASEKFKLIREKN